MHARNPYRDPPRFAELAKAYPLLSPYIIRNPDGTSIIDFKNDKAQRCLTEALLHRDFGIKLNLPSDRLCPPIPNRLNYVLWIQDIIRSTYDQHTSPIRGIDIGTGASAIYPLLACTLEPSWCFAATEIDETSFSYAQKNVTDNNLQNRIHVIPAHLNEPIFTPLTNCYDENNQYHFTMCNPPFYSSAEDVERSLAAKELEPHAVCTGADVEMITPGGEEAFVSQMVHESMEHKTRCTWYTSMLGKMSSLSHIVALLRQNNIDNYAITEFIQGQTRRWAIGWSFGSKHLPDSLARISNPTLQNIMPRRNTLHQPFSSARSRSHLADALQKVLADIEGVSVVPYEGSGSNTICPTLVAQARSNTWSRAARRRKMAVDQLTMSVSQDFVMQCQINCTEISKTHETEGVREFELEYVWTEGKERALYESFVGHVSRKVGAAMIDEG